MVGCVSLIIASRVARSEDAATSEWPTQGWSVAAPEDEGLDSGALADVVDWAKSERVDSLLVVRHGKIVLDSYYAPFKSGVPHDLYSVTKSFVSTLVAVALREQLLDSVDHPILDYFSDKRIADVDDRKRAIKVQHLLDMTSGFRWETRSGRNDPSSIMQRSPDPTEFVLDQPMQTEPGRSFNYNNGNAYVLSALITKLTGRNALEFARKELFSPLGITDVRWGPADAQNVSNGRSGLYLQPRDMAKLGYLYLRNGEWNGKRIIPASWIDRARAGAIDAAYGFRYANCWWSLPEKNAYWAAGSHNQLIVVLPGSDIVIVLTASLPEGDYLSPPDLINYIVASVRSDGHSPPNLEGQSRLQSALQSAARERPDVVEAPPPLANEVSGKSYDFEENALRLKSVTLNLAGANPTWSISRGRSTTDKIVSGPLGLAGVYPDDATLKDAPIAKGRWLDETSFEIQSRRLGYGVVDKWLFEFKGAAVNLHFEDNEGFAAEAHGSKTQ